MAIRSSVVIYKVEYLYVSLSGTDKLGSLNGLSSHDFTLVLPSADFKVKR